MDISAFLQEFRLEALEHLELLGVGLLRLEREEPATDRPDAAVVRQMFLSAHTIKGGASMLSLTLIKTLTHALEDVLGALRDGREPLGTYTVALLFETLDALRAWVEGELQPPETPPELEDLLERLRVWPKEVAREVAPVEPSPTASQTFETESWRALLLEPSPTARWVLKAQLERQGFEVVEVESLEQALETLSHGVFARVLCPCEPGGVRPETLLERFPDLEHLWVTALESLPVPPTARLLLRGSWGDELALEEV